MATLETLREALRLDLKDASDVLWADAILQRHIKHAIADLSQAIPVEEKATKATVSASRDIDVSDLHPRITIYAVEYKIGLYPQEYQRFSLFGDTLSLLVDTAPDGSNAYIYYAKPHLAPEYTHWAAATAYGLADCVEPVTDNGYYYECTTAGTSAGGEPTWPTIVGDTVADGTAVWTCRRATFSPGHDELIILGGGGFALAEYASHTINAANVGGTGAARRYQAEGARRLGLFRAELRRLGAANRVRARTLYTPALPSQSRFKVTGP